VPQPRDSCADVPSSASAAIASGRRRFYDLLHELADVFESSMDPHDLASQGECCCGRRAELTLRGLSSPARRTLEFSVADGAEVRGSEAKPEGLQNAAPLDGVIAERVPGEKIVAGGAPLKASAENDTGLGRSPAISPSPPMSPKTSVGRSPPMSPTTSLGRSPQAAQQAGLPTLVLGEIESPTGPRPRAGRARNLWRHEEPPDSEKAAQRPLNIEEKEGGQKFGKPQAGTQETNLRVGTADFGCNTADFGRNFTADFGGKSGTCGELGCSAELLERLREDLRQEVLASALERSDEEASDNNGDDDGMSPGPTIGGGLETGLGAPLATIAESCSDQHSAYSGEDGTALSRRMSRQVSSRGGSQHGGSQHGDQVSESGNIDDMQNSFQSVRSRGDGVDERAHSTQSRASSPSESDRVEECVHSNSLLSERRRSRRDCSSNGSSRRGGASRSASPVSTANVLALAEGTMNSFLSVHTQLSFASNSGSSASDDLDLGDLAGGAAASHDADADAPDLHHKLRRARALASGAPMVHVSLASSGSGSQDNLQRPEGGFSSGFLRPPSGHVPSPDGPISFNSNGSPRPSAPSSGQSPEGSFQRPSGQSPEGSFQRLDAPHPSRRRAGILGEHTGGGVPSVDTLVSVASVVSASSAGASMIGAGAFADMMGMKSSEKSQRGHSIARALSGGRATPPAAPVQARLSPSGSGNGMTVSASQPTHHQRTPPPSSPSYGGNSMYGGMMSHAAKAPTLNDLVSLRNNGGAARGSQFTQVATLSALPTMWAPPPPQQQPPQYSSQQQPPQYTSQQSTPQQPRIAQSDNMMATASFTSRNGFVFEDAAAPAESCEPQHPSQSLTSWDESNKCGEDGHKFHLTETWAQEESPMIRRRSSHILSLRSTGAGSQGGSLALRSEEQEQVILGTTCIQRLMVHPFSMKRLSWDIAGMSLLCWDVLVIPFVQAFDPPETDFLRFMGLVTMTFWSLDILASFMTGFQEKKYMVMAPGRIARRYFRTWFFLDLPIVGLDWFMISMESETAGTAKDVSKSFRTLRFMRVLRLVRMLKMLKVMQVIRDLIDTEAISICFDIFKITVLLVVINHVVACGWYAVGTIHAKENNGLTWVGNTDIDDRSLVYRYSTSLHWSLGQFAGASVETVPQSAYERLYAVIVSLAAMITFSSFISILTASMAELRRISTDEIRQFWLLRRYLRDWGVSRSVAQRVQRYAEYMYQKQKQQVQTKDVFLLTLLSEPLREELRNETLSCHLKVHPLFGNQNMHTRIFSKAVCEVCLARGDAVFLCGEQARALNFVTNNGMVQYNIGRFEEGGEGKQSEGESVGDGEWICEAALWTIWLHLGDAHAVTESQIVSISGEVFGSCVQMHSWLWMSLKQYAENFVDELNALGPDRLTDLMHKVMNPEDFLHMSGFEIKQQPMESETMIQTPSRGSSIKKAVAKFLRRTGIKKPRRRAMSFTRPTFRRSGASPLDGA